jgi:hypothetical protein
MSTSNIAYQRIYEEDLPSSVLDAANLPRMFYSLTEVQRRLVEELIDASYSYAISDAMDAEVLEETVLLSVDMADQLTGFSDMLRSYLHDKK